MSGSEKKTTKSPKLALNPETVRSLSDNEMKDLVGGMPGETTLCSDDVTVRCLRTLNLTCFVSCRNPC